MVFQLACFIFTHMKEKKGILTSKQLFLNRIEEQIKILRDAYEYNKSLPDSFFENLNLTPMVDMPTANVFKASNPNSTVRPDQYIDITEYGANRKLIIDILKVEGVGMVKWNIARRFAELTGKDPEEIGAMVTNGLSGLNHEGSIKPYKPEGLKFKGFFWTLPHWWENGQLKAAHKPFQGTVKSF